MRVQRIDLPEDVSTRVYESMKQNFAQAGEPAARRRLSAGVRIRAEAERKRTEILADARARCAAACAARRTRRRRDIYARAYSRNPEFYAFYRSLQAYERSLGKEGDVWS